MKTVEVREVVFDIVTVGFATALLTIGVLLFDAWDTKGKLEKALIEAKHCQDELYSISPVNPHYITVNHKPSGRVAVFFDGNTAIEYDPLSLGDGKAFCYSGSVTFAVGGSISYLKAYPAIRVNTETRLYQTYDRD